MNGHRANFPRFALDVYGADGVSAAALSLQDRCGVNVNVLLFAAYVGVVLRSRFTLDDAAAAAARTGPWHREVVGPLRALRTRLKEGPAPALAQETAALRDRIKSIELDAEMIELDELAALASDLHSPGLTGDAASRATEAMEEVLRHTAEREPDGAEHDAVAVIARAAARFEEGNDE